MTNQPIVPSPPPATLTAANAEALAAYALDVLPPEEMARVVAQLAVNPAARSRLSDYRAIAGVLPFTAAQHRPPVTLRDDVIRTIRNQRPRHRIRPLRLFRHQLVSAIAACLVLGILVGIIGLQMHA